MIGVDVRLRQVRISGFRGISSCLLQPAAKNVIIGPNNAGKSTVLEALEVVASFRRRTATPDPDRVGLSQPRG